jgi:cysteine synthase A
LIPRVLEEAVDQGYSDELMIPGAGDAGMHWARKLAAKEGIFTGVSGGSTFRVRDPDRRKESSPF